MAEEALDLWLSNECLVIKALIKLHESNPHIFKRNIWCDSSGLQNPNI